MGNQHGGVAQLGEHLPCKQGVMGSNPIISITQVKRKTDRLDRTSTRSEGRERKQGSKKAKENVHIGENQGQPKAKDRVRTPLLSQRKYEYRAAGS